MAVDYNDKRLTSVKADEQVALTENEKLYDGMINNSDRYYQQQIDASKQWAEKQQAAQQAQTDFAIEKIEQEKAQAKKDYIKEQSGAYVDWQRQSDPYGAAAEQRASMGMDGTGYSESSLVSMYNTYQYRVTAARESYERVSMNFTNAINEAKLQNSSILAEIAYKAQQQQLELSLQGFQYKNQLLTDKANQALTLKSFYNTKYQNVLDQINTENALAEQQRQFNESHALQEAQLALEREQWNWEKEQAAKSAVVKKSSSSGSVGSKSRSSYVKKQTNDEKKIQKAESKNTKSAKSTTSATEYLNKLIASGASKDKVSNEIAIALREGAITKAEAAKLRKTFTPRGIAY